MAQLDQVDIRTAPNNLQREDVLQQIVDISQIPMPFMSRIGRSSHNNEFFEWPADRLADPDTSNAVTDGSTAPTPSNSVAYRLGNHAQISQKTVGTSTRLESSNTVGNESLARQLAKKTQELQRDMEAILLLNQAGVQDTGVGGTAGRTAGLEAWLDDTDVTGTAKSLAAVIDASGELTLSTDLGGWSNRTGSGSAVVVPAIDYTALTTPAAVSFADVKQITQALYKLGCMPTVLMAVDDLIAKLSAFMFTSSAQIATPIRDDKSRAAATAQAAVNEMITDFGMIVSFVDNRLMQSSGDGSPDCDTMLFFDPSKLAVSYQGGGIRSKELPVSGLGRAIQIHADYGLWVGTPDAVGGIIGLDKTAAATA